MTPIVSATLLRTQSDARLALLAGQGHERAFEAIVERYRRPLHRYCRRILPEARAEDAVQQTFLKAWSALSGGTRVEDLKPWLYRIAHNAALDAAKKAGYDYDELSESLTLAPGAHDDLERRAVIRETLAGVAALPPNQREALLRTVVEGHSRAAIAADLNLTEGAVRQLVHRARLTLRAAATAVTPLPLASWAAAFDRAPDAPSAAQRIAELAGGAGSAGGAGVLLKAGAAVVATGALVVSPPGQALRNVVSPTKSDATPTRAAGQDDLAGPAAGGGSSGDRQDQRGGPGRHGAFDVGGRHGAVVLDEHGRAVTVKRGDGRFAASGLGVLDDHHGSTTSGPGGSGSSGSGSSGSRRDSSGSSSSGSSGSGSSGSSHDGSGSSGPGPSGSSDGGSGSGSSGSGSGTSGPGPGDSVLTTTTSGSDGSTSGRDGGLTSGSGGGHDGMTTVESSH